MIFVKITIRRYRGGLSVGSLASRAITGWFTLPGSWTISSFLSWTGGWWWWCRLALSFCNNREVPLVLLWESPLLLGWRKLVNDLLQTLSYQSSTYFKNCGNKLVQFVASCSRCMCISCVVNVLGSILKAANLLPPTSTMTAAPREPQGSPSASNSVWRAARASSSAGTSTSAVASSLAPFAARNSLSSLWASAASVGTGTGASRHVGPFQAITIGNEL